MECGRQRRLLAKAATRMRSMHLRHAFNVWVELTLTFVNARAQATRVYQQLLSHSLAKAIRAWRDRTCELRATRAQATKMILLLQQSTLTQAFRRWQMLAASLRSAKAAAHVLFSRAGKLDLSRVCFPQSADTRSFISSKPERYQKSKGP